MLVSYLSGLLMKSSFIRISFPLYLLHAAAISNFRKGFIKCVVYRMNSSPRLRKRQLIFHIRADGQKLNNKKSLSIGRRSSTSTETKKNHNFLSILLQMGQSKLALTIPSSKLMHPPCDVTDITGSEAALQGASEKGKQSFLLSSCNNGMLSVMTPFKIVYAVFVLS